MNAVLPELKRRAVQWITKQQAKANEQKEKQPFFLYLPLNSPHLPVAPSNAFAGKSKVGIYGDFVMETDDCIGAVLDALEKTGMADNTLVLFTSDNGGLFHDWTPKEKDDLKNYKPKARGLYTKQFGHQSNAHLRGTKADIWEGGHRVPFLIQWPNRVKPDKVCDEPIELTDVFATIAEIVDGSIPDGDEAPDSFSFLSELESKPTGKPIRPFLIHHSLYGMFSLRQGDWKYIEARGSGGFTRLRKVKPKLQEPTTQLYNLANDPSETLNLAGQKVEISKRLGLLLEKAKLDVRLRQ